MDKKIEESFALTTKLLLGKPLEPIEKYSEWLQERIPMAKTAKSSLGKGTAYLPDYSFFPLIPKDKTASLEEFAEAGKRRITEAEEGISLAGLASFLQKSALFVPNYAEGSNINVHDLTGNFNCINVSNSFDPFDTKNSAYIFSTIYSEGLFGCYRIISSKFLIHCYNVSNLNRCLEMDCAKNCSDSMFCHNVEGLTDCMFCFNLKGKRYAIANVEVGKEKYMQVNEKVLSELVLTLEKQGRLPLGIYEVLAKGK